MYSGAPELVADAPNAAPVGTVHPSDYRSGRWRRTCVIKIEKTEEAGGSLPYRPEAGEGGLSGGRTARLPGLQYQGRVQQTHELDQYSLRNGERDHHDGASAHLPLHHSSGSSVREFPSYDTGALALLPPLKRQQARAGSTLTACLDQ